MIEHLIKELHDCGLSDLAGYLKVYNIYATEQQKVALQLAVATALFKYSNE